MVVDITNILSDTFLNRAYGRFIEVCKEVSEEPMRYGSLVLENVQTINALVPDQSDAAFYEMQGLIGSAMLEVYSVLDYEEIEDDRYYEEMGFYDDQED